MSKNKKCKFKVGDKVTYPTVLNPNARLEEGELILVGDHKIQFGGSGGNGFCYTHQSFKCLENLTDEERDAIKNAEQEYNMIKEISDAFTNMIGLWD